MKFARLKPYNGKQYVLRTFTVFGIKFQEKNGWYQVEDDVADYLKSVVQIQEDPSSHKAFDVVESLDDAKEIDEAEKKRVERALAAEARPAKRVHATSASRGPSGDLTTADLKKPATGSRREKGFDDMATTFDDDMAGRTQKVTPVLDGADDEDEGVTTVDPASPDDDGDSTPTMAPAKAAPARGLRKPK